MYINDADTVVTPDHQYAYSLSHDDESLKFHIVKFDYLGLFNLLAGAKSYPYMPKSRFGNRPVSSINSEHTNKYIYTYTHTALCFNSIDCFNGIMLNKFTGYRFIMCIFNLIVWK